MRRVQRRNADVRVEVGSPATTDAKFDLFCRYLDAQHDETMSRTYETYCDFLYDSPVETCEFRYLLGERLIGVSLVDRWARGLPGSAGGLSSVYMYFDPAYAARSLGTYSVLWEVDYCRREGLTYYYLGYYVAGSGKMAYKSRFRPNEVLVGEDRWVRFRE
jgi:arginine-tRNA-protein transferase